MTTLEFTEGSKVDFFSDIPLVTEISNLDINCQKDVLVYMTFSQFLKAPKVQEFMATANPVPRMPTMRYVYFYYLFRKIGDFIGDDRLCKVFSAAVPTNINESIEEIYKACDSLLPRTLASICLIIESITRGQYTNVLWDTLRDGTISSSKFLRAIKRLPNAGKLFNPWPIKNNYYVAGPLAFGLRCEDAVKTLICELLCRNKPHHKDCGFMQSPIDGIFGVSLDLCTNVTVKNDLIVFHPDTEVYEIKCRFKYLFSKEDCDPTYVAYRSLYSCPDKFSFISFINSISRPAVEFVPESRLPTESDYLITSDDDWNVRPKRKRKITALHQHIQECLRVNARLQSVVYLLTDPSQTDGEIYIKDNFDTALVINPCHAYFYQILLQYKVVRNYIQLGDSEKDLGTQKHYIVSAFFRKRHFTDPKSCTIGGKRLDNDVEIPVLLVVTPVCIPSTVLLNNIKKAGSFWTECATKEFSNPPWASSCLFASGDITP